MTGAHVRLLAALLVLAAGCDGVAKSGETIVADNGGTIWGFNNPNAVRVEPGGTLVVANASLFGLGKRIDTFPMGMFPEPGAAIQSNGGTVRIQKGRIVGGGILLPIDPSTIPAAPPPGTDAFFDRFGIPSGSLAALAPAVAALDSVVEIDGGTLVSSSVAGQPNPYFSAPSVFMFGGQLRIRGGELLQGTAMPASPLPDLARSLLVSQTRVEISGGTFEGTANLAASRATITGGRFAAGIEVLTAGSSDRLNPPGGAPLIGGLLVAVRCPCRD